MGLSQPALVEEHASEPIPHTDFSFFNVHTDTTSQAIAAFCLLDTIPDMQILRRRVSEELARSFPRFTQVVVTKPKPRWMRPPHFDIDAHITLVRRSSVTDLSSLVAEASVEFSRPLDMSRPLWRLTVISAQDQAINGHRPVTGLLFVLHHSLTDGLGALEALYSFCGDQVRTERSNPPSGEQMISEWGSATGLLDRLAIAVRCARRIFLETVRKPGASPLNGRNSSARCGCLIRLSRQELRKIGAGLGGNLHDTLMTLLAGAVNRFHVRTGYPVRELRAIVPVSIRRSDQREEMGNLITAVGIRMPISLPTPQARLQAIHDDIERVKLDGSLPAYRLLSLILVRLPWALHRACWERMFRNSNFLCTIIPGARFRKTIAGAGIDLISGFATINRNHGSSFTFVTYCQEVSLVAMVDPAVVHDLPALESCLRESYEELRGLAAGMKA
jgi:diacylglycerol O-acyltransferase / wax synthase